MNRLNKTEPAVFLYCRFSLFLKDLFFQVILSLQGSTVYCNDQLRGHTAINKISIIKGLIWACLWEYTSFSHVNNKGTHQPRYPHSLVSAIYIHRSNRKICTIGLRELNNLAKVSVAQNSEMSQNCL